MRAYLKDYILKRGLLDTHSRPQGGEKNVPTRGGQVARGKITGDGELIAATTGNEEVAEAVAGESRLEDM